MIRQRVTLRTVGVFGLVAGLSGLVGAAGGALLGAALLLAMDGTLGGHLSGFIFLYAGGIGAINGVVWGSTFAWLLLRHVPLWRVICETAFGAVLGSLMLGIAEKATEGAFGVSGWSFFVIAPAVGATLAALRLRFSTRQQPRANEDARMQ